MTVVKRRTLWPSRPIGESERGTLFSVTIAAYALCSFALALPLGWLQDHSTGIIHEALASDRTLLIWIVGYFPFAILFQRAWTRWLRTPSRKKTTAPVEESPAELAAWASSILDKKRP